MAVTPVENQAGQKKTEDLNSKEFLEWINTEKSVGTHQVMVQSLHPPSPKHTVRAIRMDYVKQLEEIIIKKPATLLAQPLLGIVSDSNDKESFNPALVNGYKIHIIGGNHRREALQRLQTVPEVPVILYVGCTDEEVIRLAQLHNTVAQTIKFYDTIEKATYSRKMLYEMAEQKDDDEPPKRKPSKWRKICAEHLEEKVRFNILCQLQVLEESKGGRTVSSPSKVAALECSFEETAKAAKDMKEMRFVQECFQKKVGEDDWDTVKEKYPEYTTYGALKPFKGVKQLEKHPPESFIRFCLRAVKTENGDKNESTTDDDVNTSTCIAGNNVAIVKYDPDKLLDLKDAVTEQNGATLIILDMLKCEISLEQLNTILRMMKDVNMRTLTSSYRCILVVDVKTMHQYNLEAEWAFAHLKSGDKKVVGILILSYGNERQSNYEDFFTADDICALLSTMLAWNASNTSVLITEQDIGVKAVKMLEDKSHTIVFVTEGSVTDSLYKLNKT
ncbi:uncharacterized protein [Ptychodera flava]|uniref:uncharacterized protein n=1 Tax=Ptychodera flava TaxID=63121 RepID=UPI00396AAE4C